jgi:hypothetical protein
MCLLCHGNFPCQPFGPKGGISARGNFEKVSPLHPLQKRRVPRRSLPEKTMARPRKADASRLGVLLRARCSNDELVRVRAKAVAAGLTVSQFVRRAALTGKVASDEPILALVNAINRAGNLVNQQMPIAHSRGELPSELLRANAALEQALLAVARTLSR